MKIGAAGFIVPFMFVYEPSLLMIGPWQTILSSCTTAIIGVLLFSGGLHQYFVTETNRWQRPMLIIGGLLLIKPGWVTDIAGAVLATTVIVTQIIGRRAAARAAQA